MAIHLKETISKVKEHYRNGRDADAEALLRDLEQRIAQTYTKAAFRKDLGAIRTHLRNREWGKAQNVWDNLCEKINFIATRKHICNLVRTRKDTSTLPWSQELSPSHFTKEAHHLLSAHRPFRPVTFIAGGSLIFASLFPGLTGMIAGALFSTAVYAKTDSAIAFLPDCLGHESVAIGTCGAAVGAALFGAPLLTGLITGVACKALSIYSNLG